MNSLPIYVYSLALIVSCYPNVETHCSPKKKKEKKKILVRGKFPIRIKNNWEKEIPIFCIRLVGLLTVHLIFTIKPTAHIKLYNLWCMFLFSSKCHQKKRKIENSHVNNDGFYLTVSDVENHFHLKREEFIFHLDVITSILICTAQVKRSKWTIFGSVFSFLVGSIEYFW